MNQFHLLLKYCLLNILLLTLISCGSGLKVENEIIVALDSEPQRINPLFLTDLNSHMISSMVFKGLISIDEKGRPQPELAQSWEINNGGREILFSLRQDVYWHDGTKFKADDVVFTYEILNSENTASPRKGILGPIREIKALDDYTLIVKYKFPYGSAIESWTIGILPRHMQKTIIDIDFDKNPVGTGAWRIKKWQRGEFIVFEAFDKFYKGTPKLKRILVRFIPDQTTKYLEIKSGKVNVAELPFHIDVNALKDRFNQYKANSYRYICLGFNLLNPKFQIEKLRNAINYSINKEELINVVLNGNGRFSTGPYPKGVWYYNDEIKPFEYNPQLAVQILKELGMDDLRFGIYINSENKELHKSAQFIQQNLKEVGIFTQIRLFDWQTLRHRILEEKSFDAVLLSRAYLWDPDIYDLWHSSKAVKGGWNLFSFKDKEVDRLLELGRKTIDFKKRGEIYRKIHKLLYEKQACIFLYETPLVFYADKKIVGIRPNPQGMLYGMEHWQIKN